MTVDDAERSLRRIGQIDREMDKLIARARLLDGERRKLIRTVRVEVGRIPEWGDTEVERDGRGFLPKRSQFSESQVDEMIKLYAEGMTQDEIGKHFGVTQATISALMRRRRGR